jgi:hypothetical protein
VVALILYATFFIFLSVDVLLRVWEWRSRLESSDVGTLFFFEASRSVVTVAMIALLLYMLVCRSGSRWQPLMVALGFLAVWHTKAFGYSGFPGEYQERLALWLRAHHIATWLLAVVFGSPTWALWAAVAALVRFSTVFPSRVTPATIRASGSADRTGILGGSGVAGLDLGVLFRALSAAALQRGMLRPRILGSIAVIWSIAFQIAGKHLVVQIAGALLTGLAMGVVITNMRASQPTHTAIWLGRAVLAGSGLFAMSAAATFLMRGGSPLPGVVLLGVAPIAAVAGVWRAVAGAAAERSAHAGAHPIGDE